MFVAINKSGNRISSLEANKEDEYRCPVCGRKVVLKSGSIRFSFFGIIKKNYNLHVDNKKEP